MFAKDNVLCIVCSAGGHLTEALSAIEKLSYPRYFVTYRLPHVEGTINNWEHYFITNPHKNFWKYGINFIESLRLYVRKRPKFILSTGSGMAVATCLLGKLFGSKIIFIETGARIYKGSMTGRFMYYFSDLFIVQWKPLLRSFPKAVCGGVLL